MDPSPVIVEHMVPDIFVIEQIHLPGQAVFMRAGRVITLIFQPYICKPFDVQLMQRCGRERRRMGWKFRYFFRIFNNSTVYVYVVLVIGVLRNSIEISIAVSDLMLLMIVQINIIMPVQYVTSDDAVFQIPYRD